MATTPEKTLGCRAPANYHSEADRLAEKMSEKTGKRVTRTTILLMSHDYGFKMVERHIDAGGLDCATKSVEMTEPEKAALAARDLINRGWKSLQDSLANLPAAAQ